MEHEEILKIGLAAIVLLTLYIWINRCKDEKVRINNGKDE